jgi:hypothetical protein
MTVFSKQNYEDHGCILKAARKQQYIMLPAPISLKDELKEELGMKLKKEEEEADDAMFCSLKFPIDHEDKESKTYMVKVNNYESGTPEEFLKWRLTLNEQVNNNGYNANYDNVMNLDKAMLAECSLEAFLNEKRSQEVKNRIHKAKTKTEHTPSHIYDFAIFELAIRPFDIHIMMLV